MTPTRLVALLLVASLAAAPVFAADLLLDHVNGYTLDSTGKLLRFEAMLVDKGKVVATGEREAMRSRAEGAKVVNGHGLTLLPGLIDAHGHVMGLGTMKRQADLTSAKTLDDALAQVKAFASANAGSAWIVGRGWNQVIWKLGRFPTAKELDAIAGDRPVWLERVDGHAGWANGAVENWGQSSFSDWWKRSRYGDGGSMCLKRMPSPLLRSLSPVQVLRDVDMDVPRLRSHLRAQEPAPRLRHRRA